MVANEDEVGEPKGPCFDAIREIRLHGRRIGEIRRLGITRLSFAYGAEYADTPGAALLSACLAPTAQAPVEDAATAWFAGLLPEGVRRGYLARVVGTSPYDMSTLLDAVGAQCAGAVQVVDPTGEETPGLHPLEPGALAGLLHDVPVEPIATVDRRARNALAGAQDKVALARAEAGGWAVPLAGAPSARILKPQHRRLGCLVENEHWCMTIARRAGVPAARTEIATVAGTPVLVVERSDRTRAPDGAVTRLHQEAMAQALATTRKYEDEGGPGLAQIVRLPGLPAMTLIERAVLNWLVGNADGHAKNRSVLEPATARARLPSAYDVLCTESYPGLDTTLALRIADAAEPGDVTPENVAKCAAALGADPDATLGRLAVLAERLADAAADAATEPPRLRVGVDVGKVTTKLDTALGTGQGGGAKREALGALAARGEHTERTNE